METTPGNAAAANQETPLREFLNALIQSSGLRLQYELAAMHDPEGGPGWTVNFTGPDASRLGERQEELLRSLEHLLREGLRLGPRLHCDWMGQRQLRGEELSRVARLAAEQVARTGLPHEFAPMSSRERRLIHLALRDAAGVRSLSEGEGPRRHVVIQSLTPAKTLTAKRREYRRL